MLSLDHLPGAELVLPGLQDAEAGRVTIPACLVWIAMPRLARAGLISPAALTPIVEPELTLYRFLCAEGGNAYGRYNSLLRRLTSFQHSLDRSPKAGSAEGDALATVKRLQPPL